MSDEFFAKLDGKMGEKKKEKEAKADTAQTNRDFVESIMPELTGTANEYAEKCRARGIDAKVRGSARSVTFEMQYPRGGRASLVASPNSETGKLEFERHYPNDDGRAYKSVPMEWYDESNWKPEIFEQKLQKTIEDFIYYADRQGGLSR